MFQTVVFAILGKETVRVFFSEVFSKIDKQAQREGAGKTRVFVDSFRSGNGDVKEGDEGKTTRTMGWKLRSALERSNSFMYDIPDVAADIASFDPAQFDAVFHTSFDASHANALSHPTLSTAADSALNSFTPSFDAAQAAAAATSIALLIQSYH